MNSLAQGFVWLVDYKLLLSQKTSKRRLHLGSLSVVRTHPHPRYTHNTAQLVMPLGEPTVAR